MTIKVLMPALSPTMTEGTLASWHVQEGDKVEPGDVIAEIETDKATMEVEAVDEGTVGKIIVAAGTESVQVNDLIAVLLEEGEDAAAAEQAASRGGEATRSSGSEHEPANEAPPSPQPSSDTTAEAPPSPKPAPSPSQKGAASAAGKVGRIFASPLAKRLAEQAGIELSALSGSGPHGRIVKADIERAKKKGIPAAPQAEEKPLAAPRAPAAAPEGIDAKALADQLGMAYEAIPNNNIRKTIAKRLLQASQTVPEYFLTIDCEIDGLLATRRRLNEGRDIKISVNDFIIKASAMALRAHPEVNAAWTDEAVLQFTDIDVSMAVATPSGLITPIIKHADRKGLGSIAEEARDLATRARDGKLKPEEFQGGTFSVSNLGMFGIKQFTAILNPPQSCILAVGGGEQRAVVKDGQMVVATVMTCTMTCDHRTVDGAVGAQFLQTLKRFIEDPAAMLV